MKNPLAIILITLAVLTGAAGLLAYNQYLNQGPSQEIVLNDPFLDIEPPDLLQAEARERLIKLTKFMLRDLDVEFLTVVRSNLQGQSIDVAANDIVQKRRIGAKTKGAKGLLFLAAVEEKQVRFEVGYDLEPVFPDSFVGYIERDQMRPFFEEGKVGQGIEATLEMIVSKAYTEIKKGGYNPTQKKDIEETSFAGGAGAKKEVAIGIRKGPLKRRLAEEARNYFSPGKTPEETWSKYLESLRRGITDPSLDFYSDKDKEYYANWTVTKAQLRNLLRDYQNESFATEIRGDLAVLIFPVKNRRAMPIFMKKEGGGWILDFYTSQVKAFSFSHRNDWYVRSFKTEYQPLLNRHYRFDSYGYPYDKSSKKGSHAPFFGCQYFWHGYGGHGVVAHMIVPESPAEKAGIHEGDFILTFNGIPIEKPRHLTKLVREKKPGNRITLEIVHGALERKITYEEINLLPTKGKEPFRKEKVLVTLGSWPM